MRVFFKNERTGLYVFRVGNRVSALQQFDATAADIEESIGVSIERLRHGAAIEGTLDQLERFAAILDVTNTMDGCDAEYRRASIKAATRLRSEIINARRQP